MTTSVDTTSLQRALFASLPKDITDGPSLGRIRDNTDGWCLRVGHSGESVLSMKALLENAGYEVSPGNVVDAKTDAAIRAFQAANGLEVDGKVGVHTLAALENLGAVPQLADAQTLADARTVIGEDGRAYAPTVRGPELGGFYINPATGQVTRLGRPNTTEASGDGEQTNLNGGNPLVAGLGLAGDGLVREPGVKLGEPVTSKPAEALTARQRYSANQEAYVQKLRQEALGRDMAVLNKALDKEGAFVNAKPGETLEQLIKRSNGGQPGGTAERVIKELQAKGELKAYETTTPTAVPKNANPKDPFWATPKNDGPSVRQRYEAAQENAALKLRQEALTKEQAVLNQALDKNAAGVRAKPGESLDALIKRSNGGQPGGTAERVVNELRAEGKLSAHDAAPMQTATAPKGKAGPKTGEPGLIDAATTKLKGVAQDSKTMAEGALHANFSPGVAKAVHLGGKALVVAGAVMDGADVIGAVMDDVKRSDGHATQTIKTGSRVAGGWLGAMAGSAALGAAAGTVVPGLGNVAGFLIGAAGGAIGYALGSSGGEVVGEALTN